MVGTLAQMISLVSYGNEYFASGQTKDFKSHTTFKFCRFVTFKQRHKYKNEFGTNEMIFGSAYEWYEHLKNEGCKKLRLLYNSSDDQNNMPDYMSAVFVGGGGQWLIEAIYNHQSVFWTSKWIVNKFGAQDNRIWEVTYTNHYTGDKHIDMQYDLSKIKKAFLDTLLEIEAFAAKTNREPWKDRFSAAIADLNADNPSGDFHIDLIPKEKYSLVARQLLAGAQKAWVFGGMGWWNDYYYNNEQDQQTNVRLSEKLYSLICQSIVGAVNSF